MTRSEHLQWCKNRALEYCQKNDLKNAFASMMSDLGKHEETQGHMGIMLGTQLLVSGFLSTQYEMEKFIKDFN